MANSMTLNSVTDMQMTPERALAIKRALIRQYAHQNNLEITGWEEQTRDGEVTYYTTKEQPSA